MAKLGKKKEKEEDSDDHAGDDWGHGRPSILYTPNSLSGLSGLSLVKVTYSKCYKNSNELVAFFVSGQIGSFWLVPKILLFAKVS